MLLYFATVLAAATSLFLRFAYQRNSLPSHMLGHRAEFHQYLVPENLGTELRQLVKDIGHFPTNTQDLNFYTTRHEHIGEGMKTNEVGGCDHPFLTPNQNRTLCSLPGRIDIGRHFVLHGGMGGLRERFELMVSRVQSFGVYLFDLDAYPIAHRLFSSERFQTAAKRVCPASHQHLDATQFNFIVQVPGQTVAAHVDGEDRFIHQVQVVAYLHEWRPQELANPARDSGAFLYFNNSSPRPQTILPEPLGGVVVDGSKVVHAAGVYRPDIAPPLIDKDVAHALVLAGEDEWELVRTDDGSVLSRFRTADLRISIVYRG